MVGVGDFVVVFPRNFDFRRHRLSTRKLLVTASLRSRNLNSSTEIYAKNELTCISCLKCRYGFCHFPVWDVQSLHLHLQQLRTSGTRRSIVVDRAYLQSSIINVNRRFL